MKSVFAAVLVLVLAAFATYAQTDGFTVLTTEAARRAQIARQPVPVPAVDLRLATGETIGLGAELAADGRVAIVNFMYTRCPSVCVAMGIEFQQLQELIRERGLEDRIRLISISFDPRDTPEWLERYERRMRADGEIWQAMLAYDDAQRKLLLDTFGIIVVPAPLAQYEHNAAYHVVTPGGQLSRIIDVDSAEIALHYAVEQAEAQAEADAEAEAKAQARQHAAARSPSQPRSRSVSQALL